MSLRLGILTTHPIQYQVPWFRVLARQPGIDLRVFFCLMPDPIQQGAGFDVPFRWDVALLQGYSYQVLDNVAKRPGVTSFNGCDTPGFGKVMRQAGIQVLLVNGWVVKSCLQALWHCRWQGIPCIVRGESNSLRARKFWVGLSHRILLQQYAACLAIGTANRTFYLQNGVPSKSIFMTPYSVDNEWFAAKAHDLHGKKELLRAAWGIPATAITYLYCAKFIDKKRPLDLLEALRIALEQHKTPKERIHILMVGDGSLLPECKNYSQRHQLPTTFTGFLNQSEVVRAYVVSDCLVLTSDFGETWGLVVNEAMACGLPAIVSDRVGCHPDLIKAGQTGEVFPFGDCPTLAALMSDYSKQVEKLREMGELARILIADYSIPKVVEGILEAVRYCCFKHQFN